MSPSMPRVHHMTCACIQRLRIHGKHLCCHVLLVETPRSGLVLVDTGLGTQDYADLTSRLTRSFVYGYARPKRDPALAAVNQIRALGFSPDDVRHIVMTHMDLDHVGGLSDFPKAKVHLHAAELKQCTERRTFRDKHRYLPAMWAHGLDTETYAGNGEAWFGFEAVRELRGLPPEILMIPLFGHTLGHCGVAIQSRDGWLLHAGDAYFDPREVKGEERRCAWQVGLFQALVQTDRSLRLHNQDRLRRLTADHPEIEVFCAHNPWEFEECQGRGVTRRTAASTGAAAALMMPDNSIQQTRWATLG
ncbi:MAG: MBL fold metallo-hydrolase [Proteobacteria bacterium]|uniref:MBL fold metallo-hydrolase n=1 Tax=Rudaea sp. TaxID=2136325 RepID=UPI0037843F7D|nr:MBL fold metallo-hydrolase [Pseudomonadota bacterium]